MDYKKLVDDIKSVVLGKEQTELAVEKEKVEEVEAPAEVEAAPQYVTATEFQAFRDENEKFKSDLMETFEKMIEMVGQNEKNNVPEELAAVKVKEEVVEEVKEEVELAAQEVVVHSPDEPVKEMHKFTYGKQGDSIQSRIWDVISRN